MTKILITGGAGYVGTSLIPLLLERGYHVKIFDNLLFGGDQLLPFFRNKNFEFTKGDVRDDTELAQAMKDCDIIIHLAAIVGFPACRAQPELARTVNVEGTKNLANLASRNQLILFASTGSSYGAVIDICTEETPLNPLSLYGQTKSLGEQALLAQGLPIIYRFATAFGVSPRLRLDLMINDFVHKALTQQYLVVYEKNFMRTFIHVHDICRSFLFGIEHADPMRGQIYNVGSEHMNFSKEDIASLISTMVKCYVHFADVGEDADKRNYEVSYKKIRMLGYDTTISIEEGIRELVAALQVINSKTPYANL